jgi:hypothetical protein
MHWQSSGAKLPRGVLSERAARQLGGIYACLCEAPTTRGTVATLSHGALGEHALAFRESSAIKICHANMQAYLRDTALDTRLTH